MMGSVHACLVCRQGGGDDTALNAVEAGCSSGGTIVPTPGIWGSWRAWATCDPGTYFVGEDALARRGYPACPRCMMMTHAASCGLACQATAPSSHSGRHACMLALARHAGIPVSQPGPASLCHGCCAVIAGARLRIEARQGDGDDTAANSIEFRCGLCMHEPHAHAAPHSGLRSGRVAWCCLDPIACFGL